MGEEEVVAVISIDNTTNNLKRKFENFEEPPSSSDVVASDSSELNAGDNVVNVADENCDDEPSKRSRLDEQGNEDGHKSDGDNGHTKEDAETGADVEKVEPGDDVENTETTVDDEADCDETAKEAIPEEENERQPVPEVEKKDDAQRGNSEEIDAQTITTGEAQRENTEKTSGDKIQEPAFEVAGEGESASAQHPDSRSKSVSKKIDIPNNKVGVLIGKSGDTIKYLQINSGAKIQITRDADTDPRAATRAVELLGTLESLNKAERLIKDVITVADAGGSPSLVARGFTTAMSAGFTEVELPVPGDKLMPQNITGEQGKEKKVKITGDKKQVEVARELIKEIWLLPSTCGIGILVFH